ncbi:MAG: SMC-Scp complex subunit ScpB [Candidatus Dormibacteraeota bacterium]|nr:SMC-Scp complex subunit ScpB [Candidatus Dormibacteraeota bacterium]
MDEIETEVQVEDEETFELALDMFGRAIVPEGVAGAEPEDLAVALEAVCFSLNRPVTLAEAAGILGRTPAAVSAAAESLAGQLRGRGLMVQRHGDHLQLVTRPETAWAVQRALQPERPTRLSRPALETLAIVAYRQPLTRAGIEAIRGVNCEAVLENLERRGLITEVDRQDTPGRPRLFGTTLRFLQIVGLERIDDLPPLGGDELLAPLATAHDGGAAP